jgi:hypothetical protein
LSGLQDTHCFGDIISDHLLFALLDPEGGLGLHISWKGSLSVEIKFSPEDLLGGTCRDRPFTGVASVNPADAV